MSTPPFVHLHCHSHFSLLDGASSIGHLVDRAKKLGMDALALTDHGNLHGALQFYETAKAAGINPILGYEAYIAPGSRFVKDAGSLREASYHLTLLAQDRSGFKNLMKIASRAFLEGFYFKPRIDKEILASHNEGIVCLSGCVSSELSQAILRGHDGKQGQKQGMEIAAWFHRLFGDRYFIEIQNNGLEIQRLVMDPAVDIARRMGLPLVCTSDTHYVRREDAEAQDVLLCINTGKCRSDSDRLKMEGDQFYLRSPGEMYQVFSGYEEALGQSQSIADSVDIDLHLGKRHFPTYSFPQGKTPQEFLRGLCLEGLQHRYADLPERWHHGELAVVVLERLDRELEVINKLGFANYFLIVWDFVRFARERDIPATARGSGVGSLVCYALYLSHVCPLKYDLLFERFLDESRLEAPDIDIDFCKERRGDVIQYVKDKYGEANVAQIGTFGTLAARAAIRDVGRALGLPLYRVDTIVAMVPEILGISLREALASSEELRTAYENEGEIRELIDLAIKIEGLARNLGTHAAAVVIGDRPLDEYVPLGRVAGKTEVITQWAMQDVEKAGLLKMDFLGLRNLTILSKTVDLIAQTTGERVDPYKLPLDDQDSFDLLCRGETKGIFQLESSGIRDLLRRIKPDHLRDIIAINALYRPGPLEGGMVDNYIEVKHGRKKAVYPHPVMKEILEETHGVMVYQEQVMRILNRLGGIKLSDAYSCIKAISKKKLTAIAKFKETFVHGALREGLSQNQATELFSMIEKFAGYGFNKSHSTAYALIAYMTAYLKTHYPVEFMAALLSSDISGRNFKKKDALVEHLEDCRRRGIVVAPPDINTSGVDFTVADGNIYFGLSAVKGCGRSAAEVIVSARCTESHFQSLFDFCERVESQVCNRAAIENLIKAGSFDSMGGQRSQLMDVLDRALQAGSAAMSDRRSGQKSLFGDEAERDFDAHEDARLPAIPEWEEKEKLAHEKEVLGFYLSSHPLMCHQEKLDMFCSHKTSQLTELSHRTPVLVGGILSGIKFSHTKRPRAGSKHTKYAMFDLEDMSGTVHCILWPEPFCEFGQLIEPNKMLAVRGTIDRRPGSEEVNLIAAELIPLEGLAKKYMGSVVVRIDEQIHGEQGLKRLHEIVRAYPGDKPLKLLLCLADGSRVSLNCECHRVDLNSEIRRRVEDLLGPGNFRLSGKPLTDHKQVAIDGALRQKVSSGRTG